MIYFHRHGKHPIRIRSGEGHDSPVKPQGIQPSVNHRARSSTPHRVLKFFLNFLRRR